MSMDLTRIAARLLNAPLLIQPDRALMLFSYLAPRFGLAPLAEAQPFMARAARGEGAGADEPYRRVGDFAVIAIHGELVNRGSWLNAASGLVSYESLGDALRQARADSKVRGVILDIDSLGGEAAGAMETADLVRSMAMRKPVKAFVNATGASAAYAIASGAREIIVTPSAIVGSIGVVCLHLDRSAALAQGGVKPTLIHAGAYKVDGNQVQPLDPDARARIQASIDDFYDLFIRTVGKLRPGLGAAGARRTEAAIFMGDKAVAAGLADRVGTFEDVLASLQSVSGAAPRAAAMAPKIEASPAAPSMTISAAPPAPAVPLEPAPKSPAAIGATFGAATRSRALQSARERGISQADTERFVAEFVSGAIDERARLKEILTSPEAKGREKLAEHIAFKTEFSVAEAIAALGASAVAPLEHAPGSRLARAPTPDIKPDMRGDFDQSIQTEVDRGWGDVVAHINQQRGVK